MNQVKNDRIAVNDATPDSQFTPTSKAMKNDRIVLTNHIVKAEIQFMLDVLENAYGLNLQDISEQDGFKKFFA